VEEISLREILYILRRRLWFIIILFIASMLVIGLVSYFILDKEYEASTTLMVGRPKDWASQDGIDYDEIMLNQKLVSTYGELIKIRAVADKVIENLGLNISYEQYKSKVKVNFIEGTELIRITVYYNSPKLSADIANEVAQVFMETVKSIMKLENIQVVDEAHIPVKPVKPKPILNTAIAGVFGVVVGMFIAIFREYLDNTIKTYKDVEEYLRVQVLGTIPKVKGKNMRRNVKLLALKDQKSGFSESFKSLRTNIQFISMDKELKIIVVTSTGAGEGKTTVASNLAISFSQAEKRVLLIDCNMREPYIHEVFGIENEDGLTNILTGEKDLEEVLFKGMEEMQSLSIVTSGPVPSNPAEMLGSNQMKCFLENIRNQFDIVIIDSPSSNIVTDSVILSAIADGTIMVTEFRKTDKDAAKKGIELLEKVHANLIGVVLNKVSEK